MFTVEEEKPIQRERGNFALALGAFWIGWTSNIAEVTQVNGVAKQ